MTVTLPANFDPATHLIFQETDDGHLHIVRESASFARRLVEQGGDAELELAEKVLEATLDAQELHPDDPHYGNFWWYLEDAMVEDLNAVEFVLATLIPMMIEHGDRLPPSLRERLLAAIRLGLEEIRRLDVLPAYTNITAKDILNSSLGGELLDDPDIARRGYKKLVAWMAFTDQFGTTYEFNSPTYSRVTLNALAELIAHVRDEDTRLRARVMATRLGLSVALHIHPRTGRWAGPHSRAYQPTVVAETQPEIADIRRWIAEGLLPAWIMDAIDARPMPFGIAETAFPPGQLGLYTWHGNGFDLGTSTSAFGDQSNVMMAHYDRPDTDRPGVFYTRYLTNDKWLGDFYHDTDRSTSRNLIEEGRFYGVQSGPRAIGAYIPAAARRLSSAKVALIWTRIEGIERILVDGKPVSLPCDVGRGDLVVIDSGGIFQAVRPFTISDLGRGAPLRLRQLGGDLVFELYNYLGNEKSFWEMDWPGGFYKGRTQAAFFTEIADRAEYASVDDFIARVGSGTFIDEVAAPFAYSGAGVRLWKLGYRRDGVDFGLEVDLMRWQLESRWNEAGDIGWPMMESPMARSNRDGRVTVGDASFTAGKETAWLFACPEQGRYVAGYNGRAPVSASLEVPGGSVTVDALTTGMIVWDRGTVSITRLGSGPADIEGGKPAADA